MEYRIQEMPAFRFAGVAARVPMQFEGENPAIARLAGSITEEQRAEMHCLMDLDPREVVNVSWDSDTDFQREEGELTHLIGVLTTRPAAEVGAGLATLEAGSLPERRPLSRGHAADDGGHLRHVARDGALRA